MHAQTHAMHIYFVQFVSGFVPRTTNIHAIPVPGTRLSVIRPGSGLDRYVWTDEKKRMREKKKTRQVHLIRTFFFLTIRICTRNCYKWSSSRFREYNSSEKFPIWIIIIITLDINGFLFMKIH